MNTRWFRPEHRDPALKQDFVNAVANSTVLQTRFLEILNDMEEELTRYESNLDNYTGDWAVKQAFINGDRSRIREIRRLFNFN